MLSPLIMLSGSCIEGMWHLSRLFLNLYRAEGFQGISSIVISERNALI
jgi:hypothetical protein